MLNPKQKYTRDEALQRVKQLCRLRELSQQQAIDKLLSYGFSFAAAQEMLVPLVQGNFIDDSRFASAFINDKVKLAHWGRNKINTALKKHGISSKTATFAWSQFSNQAYITALEALMENKWDQYQPQKSWDQRQKFFRFLAQRGFEFPLIQEIYTGIIEKRAC